MVLIISLATVLQVIKAGHDKARNLQKDLSFEHDVMAHQTRKLDDPVIRPSSMAACMADAGRGLGSSTATWRIPKDTSKSINVLVGVWKKLDQEVMKV